MSGQVAEGMDPARVREIATRLRRNADRVDEVCESGRAQLGVLLAQWSGPDLEGFQDRWEDASPQVRETARLMRAAIEDLFAQADAQVEASGGEGGGGRGFGLPEFDLPDLDWPDWDWPDVDWPRMQLPDLGDVWDGFVDLLEEVGDWWDDLPLWAQIVIGVVAAAVIVLVAIAAGLEIAGALAVVAAIAAVAGVLITIMDMLDAVAEFLRDPEAAIRRFLENPLSALDDLVWLAVGFLPYGIGKVLKRFRKPIRDILRKGWDKLPPGFKGPFERAGKKVKDKIDDWAARQLSRREFPNSPVAGGKEYKGTGAGKSKNNFPQEARPGEVLYRTDENGKVTYYQEYGSDGRPTKRVDISPDSKPHGGVPPPHVQEYERHTDPSTGETHVRKSKKVRAATPDEVRGL